MCNKLFIEKDCCFDCLCKYIPFGKADQLHKFSREEAQKIHSKIDEFYANPTGWGKILVEKLRKGT